MEEYSYVVGLPVSQMYHFLHVYSWCLYTCKHHSLTNGKWLASGYPAFFIFIIPETEFITHEPKFYIVQGH